ncbi:hypothetical protein [Corynebacterium uterequi]|uniref:Secreted protein n=1 Tax=Corynebacterium uterequi TaxID=1072256 RepID=A0A0G3HDN6_9CORY|nr:hypothetical protein [Corynebacterium uterequi]AKK11424.1 hypothetical protein CUTER_07175 [Corynebacterium uterequi]
MISSSLRIKPRAAAAMVLVAPLVVSGCGSQDDGEASDVSRVTATAAPVTTTAPSPRASDKPTVDVEAGGVSSASASAQGGTLALPTKDADKPGANLPQGMAAPLEGAAPAGAGDADALTQLVTATASQETLVDQIQFMEAHLCQPILDRAPESGFSTKGVPDYRLSDLDTWDPNPQVSDIRVDGDQASATVTSNGDDVRTWRFAREGGEWKICE